MKLLLFMSAALFLPAMSAFAHEGETEFTNLAEAEWVGPLIAVLIIIAAIIVARMMRGSRAISSGAEKEGV